MEARSPPSTTQTRRCSRSPGPPSSGAGRRSRRASSTSATSTVPFSPWDCNQNPGTAMNRRLLLLVPVALDMVWVYANRPAGTAVNPFFLYLVFFGIGVFVLSLVLAPAAQRLRRRVGPAVAFLGLGLALSITEEVIAYLTRSGLFEDGKHALGPGLVQAALPLLALPVIAYSYFVLIYLSYRAIEADVRPRARSFWRVPAIIGIPAVLWLIGGIFGHYLTRGAAA